MTADVLCDEGVVKQSARVQLRRRSTFPAAGYIQLGKRGSVARPEDPRSEGGGGRAARFSLP